MNRHHSINYLEIPSRDIASSKAFLARFLDGPMSIMALNTVALWMSALLGDSIKPT